MNILKKNHFEKKLNIKIGIKNIKKNSFPGWCIALVLYKINFSLCHAYWCYCCVCTHNDQNAKKKLNYTLADWMNKDDTKKVVPS